MNRILLCLLVSAASAFVVPNQQQDRSAITLLPAAGNRYATTAARSKRQERVGQLVHTELSQIIHSGHIKTLDTIDADLLHSISIVSTDVSPDLRQARVAVSIRSNEVSKRRAYSWLVRNTKAIRHALAQRMSHVKSCPNLQFVQVNVGAAVDVMYLIDSLQTNTVREVDFNEQYEEDEWDEEDGDFF